MRRFLRNIAIWSAVLFVLGTALDIIISQGLLSMDDYRFQCWREILAGDASSDIVVLGNSRALSHYEPHTIDSICGKSTYNLGIGGYPINVELAKYRCYRAHNPKPGIVVFDVSAGMLQMINAPHQHQSEQFFPLVYDTAMRRDLRSLGFSVLDLYLPIVRYWGYQQVIKNGLLEGLHLKHYVNEPSKRGLHYERGEWNGAELARLDTVSGWMNPVAQRLFEEFLDECVAEDIQVVLVYSPIYVEANAKTTNREAVHDYFAKEAEKRSFHYWDYSTDYPLCADSANFVVSVHMNPHATHQFSVDFSNELKMIIK